MTPISSMPTIVDQAAIEGADGLPRTWCQTHVRDWVAGTGFTIAYCMGAQRYLISWSVADRWRTRRQLRVCSTHGAAFAAANGLTLEGQHVAPSAVPSSTDDPFNDDADQPYERVRAAQG